MKMCGLHQINFANAIMSQLDAFSNKLWDVIKPNNWMLFTKQLRKWSECWSAPPLGQVCATHLSPVFPGNVAHVDKRIN